MKTWIARDFDDSVWLFTESKPYKCGRYWDNDANGCKIDTELSDWDLNNLPQWSDDEPIEVELTIKKK